MLTADLETYLTENGVSVASIFTPRDSGKWRVTLRDGPAWIVGEPDDTLIGALESAMVGFRRDWVDKRGARKSPPVTDIDDDLERLLG